MSKPSTIAIDGTAASGKSTVGELLARSLDYLYFDTGVMYRAVTWATLARAIDHLQTGKEGGIVLIFGEAGLGKSTLAAELRRRTAGEALRWLAGLEGRPFLLWVHYYDAHWPFAAPVPFAGRYRTAYLDGVPALRD